MKNKFFSFSVHSELDAYRMLNCCRDSRLRQFCLNCYVDDIVYSVFYDSVISAVCSQCYPFLLKNQDIRQAFKDAIFAIYHDNFL